MKTLPTVLVTLSLALATGLSSAEDNYAPTAKPGAEAACCDKAQMEKIDEHMKRMQAMHERLWAAATAPAERTKTLFEQRHAMHLGMAMMKDMQNGSAMMGGAGMGMMNRKGGPGDPRASMQMMQKRMEMIQIMMQMMMDQQDASATGMMPAPTR